MHDTQRHQAVDRLGRIDGMPAGDGNPRRSAHRFAAHQDVVDDLRGQLADGHAHNRQRHDGLRAHGIDIGQCIGGRDTAEIHRIVHDGHEEIGGGDDGLIVVEAVHRRVVAGLGSDHQIGVDQPPGHVGQNFAQHGRRNFAAAAAAVRKLC